MRVGLAAELSPVDKERLGNWLTAILETPQLELGSHSPFPFAGGLHIYHERRAKVLWYGAWDFTQAFQLFIGQANAHRDRGGLLTDRLAVLAAIITQTDLWEDLVDQFSAAVSRSLLEQYNSMMSGLLVTRGQTATGLAFNAERSVVAARMGEEQGFYLPNGEPVEVDPTSWTVVQ